MDKETTCLVIRAQGGNRRKQLESCQCKGILLLGTITSCPKSQPLGRPSLWNHKCRLKAVLDHGRWKTCEQLRTRLKVHTRNAPRSSAMKIQLYFNNRGMEGWGKEQKKSWHAKDHRMHVSFVIGGRSCEKQVDGAVSTGVCKSLALNCIVAIVAL